MRFLRFFYFKKPPDRPGAFIDITYRLYILSSLGHFYFTDVSEPSHIFFEIRRPDVVRIIERRVGLCC